MAQLQGGIIGQYVEPTTSAKVTTFTSSGTFHKGAGDKCNLLVVAGGGSGGGELGGGGGAGGFRQIGNHPLPSSPVAVTIGAGGATKYDAAGNDGNNSIFDSEVPIASIGGGGGGANGPSDATSRSRTGGSGGGSRAGDPKDASSDSLDFYTKLIIHSDTYDGDTTFIDSSIRGHDLVANGDAHHSTEQAKFGKTSIKFDGTLDSVSTRVERDDFCFTDEDFTVECWIYCTAAPNTYNAVFNNFRDDDSTSGWSMLLYGTNPPIVHCNIDGTHNNSTNAITLDQWQHLAMVRYGNTIYRYIDGTEAGNTLSYSGSSGSTTQELYIGSSGSEYTNREFTGYIDEIRIIKGYALYTENFTAPTKPFPDNPYGMQGTQGGGGGTGYPSISGGGGGAAQVGSTGGGYYPASPSSHNYEYTYAGKGGDGITSSISGSSVSYAGGGGGGTWQSGGTSPGGRGGIGGGGHGFGNQYPGYSTNQASPSNGWPAPAPSGVGGLGTVNTGGGGGGGSNAASYGAGGGSGVVIVSEPAGSFTVQSGVYNMEDVFHYRTQGQW